jgi:hypothetical protein
MAAIVYLLDISIFYNKYICKISILIDQTEKIQLNLINSVKDQQNLIAYSLTPLSLYMLKVVVFLWYVFSILFGTIRKKSVSAQKIIESGVPQPLFT